MFSMEANRRVGTKVLDVSSSIGHNSVRVRWCSKEDVGNHVPPYQGLGRFPRHYRGVGVVKVDEKTD